MVARPSSGGLHERTHAQRRADAPFDRGKLKMMTKLMKFGRVAVLAGAAASWVGGGLADVGDYEFRLVSNEVKQGSGTVVAVKLVNKKTGQAVPNATIYSTRLDMSPDGMPTMTESVEAAPSTEPGVYRFKTNLTMAGNWALSLAAKVQGETGTVQNKLVIKAVK
jgi:hypothetical protein